MKWSPAPVVEVPPSVVTVTSTVPAAPGGVMFDEPARIHRQARLIGLYAIRSNAMPPGNVTEMTPEERATLAAWIEAGAP